MFLVFLLSPISPNIMKQNPSCSGPDFIHALFSMIRTNSHDKEKRHPCWLTEPIVVRVSVKQTSSFQTY